MIIIVVIHASAWPAYFLEILRDVKEIGLGQNGRSSIEESHPVELQVILPEITIAGKDFSPNEF